MDIDDTDVLHHGLGVAPGPGRRGIVCTSSWDAVRRPGALSLHLAEELGDILGLDVLLPGVPVCQGETGHFDGLGDRVLQEFIDFLVAILGHVVDLSVCPLIQCAAQHKGMLYTK